MKLLKNSWVFVCLLISTLVAESKDLSIFERNDVVQAELSASEPFIIPVHPNRTLTIGFPETIEGVYGKGFTRDPSKVSGDYLLDFVDDDRFLALSMVSNQGPNALATPPWNLNIIIQGQIYVLKPMPVSGIGDAWSSLTFRFPAPPIHKDDSKDKGMLIERDVRIDPVSKTDQLPERNAKPVSAMRMLGMIDTLKMLGQLDERMVQLTLRSMSHLDYSAPVDSVRDFGFAEVRIIQVVRYDQIDALAFDILITNPSNSSVSLDVENVGVRVGEHAYVATLSDIPPVVPANSAVRGYFVVSGDGMGRRNEISVDNDFYPIVSVRK